MIGSDYILEAMGIFHTTEVDTGGCFNGGGTSALVLKGVNLTVHSGEVMAILGSKGSGKRALLDVIARRADGATRGQVLLNGSPLSQSLFQQRCGYVTHSCDFIPGLTVAQTLHYTPTILSGYLKTSKVRQILADLALSQVGSKRVEYLNTSEKRRLAIGIQLVRDPVMLLLDEPTQGLDPLSAYLLISILSNSAKKTGCGILLSLEKPRSDVFPFLDRALFLCLGGVVYSGGTRAMLEYFHAIGFPCPQLENPLMYYLCLSTVDRRSRDRFVESSQQIEALVERFSRETSMPETTINAIGPGKIPLAYGKPGQLKVWGLLYLRLLASTFSCSMAGIQALFLRLISLPLIIGTVWIFYANLKSDESGYFSKNGLILNVIGLTYGVGILSAVSLFPVWRVRFMQEHVEGLYSGGTLLIAYNAVSIPFSAISSAAAACIVYLIILGTKEFNSNSFAFVMVAIWSSFVFAEQLCITLFIGIKSRINTAITVSYILCVLIILASGTVRSFKGLSPWLQDNVRGIQTHYVSTLLHSAAFLSPPLVNCSSTGNGTCIATMDHVAERVGQADVEPIFDLLVALAIALGQVVFNIIVYMFPVPRCIQRKFRN